MEVRNVPIHNRRNYLILEDVVWVLVHTSTDHSKINLPENKNLPNIINNCLTTFSEDQQQYYQKKLVLIL